jgi:hypothetical protein
VTAAFRLGAPSLAGKDADFLKLDLQLVRPADGKDPVLKVRWASADPQLVGEVFVTASGPRLLVPLGSCPSWLLNPKLTTLEVSVQNPASGARFAVTNAELLRLRPLE